MTELQSLTIPVVGESENSQEQTYLGYLFGAACYDENIVVPSSLKEVIVTDCNSIGDYAFYKCNHLTKIIIPETITRLGARAFEECSSLVCNEYDNAYYLGNEINPYVLLMKNKLSNKENYKINTKTKIIYRYAFYDCKYLKTISIPDGVISIGDHAFGKCSSLVYNEYDNGYYLGNETNPYLWFIQAKSKDIKSCEVHSDTEHIVPSAFEECKEIRKLILHDHLLSIGASIFTIDYSKVEIYYDGTPTKWSSLTTGDNDLFSSTIYYYSEIKPTEEGNYWHYMDGVVTKW